jgi:hypothetical protein
MSEEGGLTRSAMLIEPFSSGRSNRKGAAHSPATTAAVGVIEI